MKRLVITCLATVLTACAGGDAEPPPPYRPVGDVQQTMALVLEPAVDVIWDSAGSIVTAEGEQSLAPTSDEEWLAVKHSAAVVAESGNLLMMPGRARDREDWTDLSLALVRAGERAMVAAEAQDADALFEVGGEIYNVCVACHQLYWSEGGPR